MGGVIGGCAVAHAPGVSLLFCAGVLLPVVCCLLILVPLVTIAIVLGILRVTRRKPEWEINPDEIDVGEPLGMGGCVPVATGDEGWG